MDERIVEFITQLSTRFAKTGKICNLAEWTQFCKIVINNSSYIQRNLIKDSGI
jgi:hypothetical protein